MRPGRALIEIEQATKPRTSIDPAGGTVRGSPLTSAEAGAVQAFHYFGGCNITELARRFHRNRRTIRKALASDSM